MLPRMALLAIPVAELNSFDLPPVCVVSGEDTQVTFRPVKFVWSPRWIPVLIFFPYAGLLLALVVTLAMRKRAAGELPFSETGWERYRRGVWMSRAGLLTLLAGMGGMVALLANHQSGAGVAVGVGGLIATIVLHVTGTNLGISVQRITLTHLELKIPSEAVALRFRERLQRDGVRQAVAV